MAGQSQQQGGATAQPIQQQGQMPAPSAPPVNGTIYKDWAAI